MEALGGGRPRARGAAPGAGALRRRAAAARAGARLGAASRGAVPRRADRQPRPRRDARDRDRHQGLRCRRHQDRDVDPQPRSGAAPGRRGDLPAPGARRRARAGRAFLPAAGLGRGRRLRQRRACHGPDAGRFSPHCFALFLRAGAAALHHRRLDHLDRAIRPVQAPAAGLREARAASRCAWSRSAPGRRSTWAGAATPTWSSCMPSRSRRNSSPRASACSATR